MQQTGNPEKPADYYDDIYRRGYDTHGYDPIYRTVIDIIGKLNAPRVLEVGCGTGGLAQKIIERGIPYRGFDFSTAGIACCRKLCPAGDFRVADAYDPTSYQPADYNVVVAIEVLEHVDDLQVIGLLPPHVRLLASLPDFPNEAHLRYYVDAQKDIVERFAARVKISGITQFVYQLKDRPGPLTVHLLDGVTRSTGENQNIVPDERLSPQSILQPAPAKIGRNDLCPCGSGKKYKTCCLRVMREPSEIAS
ncbi:methyltransferase domain-containing protein [Candidatus Zixiibacteriota bacterium]